MGKAEELFARLYSDAPIGLAFFDTQLRYVQLNKWLARLIDAPDEKMILGLSVGDTLPDISRGLVPQLQSVLETSEAVGNGIVHAETAAHPGKKRLYEHSSHPVLGKDGVLVGLTCIVQDITERKKQERRATTTEQMASLGSLAASIGHEINNPLAAVMASLEFLGDELKELAGDSPSDVLAEVTDVIKVAHEASERIRRTVQDLKLFSQPTPAKPAVLDVVLVLRTAIRMCKNELRHRAWLETELGPIPHVRADKSSLLQIFINLLVNAGQAMNAENQGNNEISVITTTDDAGDAVIEFRDNGRGMSQEVVETIFEPMVTTKEGAAGLGLAIVRRHIEDMGGEIVCTSRLGLGSIFRIRLPSVQDSVEPEPKAPAPPANRSGPSRKVLVVDDDGGIRRLLVRFLGRRHDVTAAAGGQEALDLFAGGQLFDVIICDLMMPAMSGKQYFLSLQELAPEQAGRVVFLTGGIITPDVAEFVAGLPEEPLSKPFDSATLEAAIESVASRPQQLRKPSD